MVTFNRHQDWAFLCAIRVSIPRALREHAESSIGLAPRGRMSVLFSDEDGVSQRPKLFISAVCAVQFSVLFPLSRQMAIMFGSSNSGQGTPSNAMRPAEPAGSGLAFWNKNTFLYAIGRSNGITMGRTVR